MLQELQVASSTTPWTDPNLLADLLDYLRQEGFKITTDEYVLAQDLVLALIARGEDVSNPQKLKTYLTPVLCTNPREQQDFPVYFERWLSRTSSGLQVIPATTSEREVAVIGNRWHQWRWILAITALCVSITILLAFIYFHRTRISIGGDPVPVPATGNPQTPTSNRPLLSLGILLDVALAIGLTALAWNLWWYHRGQIFLKRRPSTEVPKLTSVTLDKPIDKWPDRASLRRAAREMRRRYPSISPDLDINSTIEQTIRNLGHFSPVFCSRFLIPEYLVLIDRASFRDHSTRYFQELLSKLETEQVLAKKYYFDNDARVLTPLDGHAPPAFLEDVVGQHSNFRIVIFSDFAGFFNSVSGELEQWAEILWQQPHVYLLASNPQSRWGYQKETLLEKAPLFPASAESIEILAQQINGEYRKFLAPDATTGPFPAELLERPRRWLERDPLEPELVDEVLEAVRRFLGEDGYLWLSACAAYPEIDFNLTLYLGTNLRSTTDEPLFNNERASALFQLPWLRYAYMPDWLRLRLIRSLPKKYRAKIREVLNRLWLPATAGNNAPIDLEIAHEHPYALAYLARSVFERIRGKSSKDSPVHDYVFASLMLGHSLDPLAVRIPSLWRKVLERPKERTEVAAPVNRAVLASTVLGTALVWYDFFLFGTLAVILSVQFYPPGNSSFAVFAYYLSFAVGLLMRPLGAIVFGRIGDKNSRKSAFVKATVLMGLSTFSIGLLPTYSIAGWFAPAALVVIRILQGLSAGGGPGGAAVYLAEHSPDNKRGFYASIVHLAAGLGFLFCLAAVQGTQVSMASNNFRAYGWRLLFLFSILPVAVLLGWQAKLTESPVFGRMQSTRITLPSPLYGAFRWSNARRILISLFCASAGHGVVWYTAYFYSLFFLQLILRVEGTQAYMIVIYALLLSLPFIGIFGALSDRIGRKKVMMAGCLLAVLTYYPIYQGMQKAAGSHVIAVSSRSNSIGAPILTSLVQGSTGSKPAPAAPNPNVPILVLLVFLQMAIAAMIDGPIAAYLVEVFPANVRYTSSSVSWQIGSGVFATLVPFIGAYACATTGNIYAGLIYPAVMAGFTFLLGIFFLQETRSRRLWTNANSEFFTIEDPALLSSLPVSQMYNIVAEENASTPSTGIPAFERLNEFSRVFRIFITPSKTFTDLHRSAAWWAPFLLVSIASITLTLVVDQKIGFRKVAEDSLAFASPSIIQRLEQLPPDLKDKQLDRQAVVSRIASYAAPLYILLTSSILAGVVFLSLKIVSKVDIRFKRVFAVVMYAQVPAAIFCVVAAVAVIVGAYSSPFLLGNLLPTNPAYFMNPADSRVLHSITSLFDIFTFWKLWLIALGLTYNSQLKRTTAFIIVFSWWAIYAVIIAILNTAF